MLTRRVQQVRIKRTFFEETNVIRIVLSAELITQCWGQIIPLRNSFESDGTITIRSCPDALDGLMFGGLATTLITHLEPARGTEIARPNHNSLTLDIKTPIISNFLPRFEEQNSSSYSSGLPPCDRLLPGSKINIPIYRACAWPYLLGCGSLEPFS